MKPFTQEDLDGLNQSETKEVFCNTCIYEKDCITLPFQNKLSIYRDGKGANDIWGCTNHKTEDEALEEEIKTEEVTQ